MTAGSPECEHEAHRTPKSCLSYSSSLNNITKAFLHGQNMLQLQNSGIRVSQPRQNIESNWKQIHCVEHYYVETSIKREMARAIDIFDKLEKQLYQLCEHTIRCRRTNFEELVESAAHLVDCVIRNPDALTWLCCFRDLRKPIYLHTIRLAVSGVVAGRQLGLNQHALSHLCSALLMTGIGKSHVSEQALAGYCPTKTSLEYQKHLHETLYQLREIRFSSEDIINTLQSYCERIDGSGFPFKKTGDSIPFLSQLCGLIETYELLINPYDASRAISPANAAVYLDRSKQNFDSGLVDEFIRAIGVYPTGTLVELSDGQKGVIVSQNYEKRRRAAVIPILCSHGNILKKLKVMSLSYTDRREGEDDRLYIRKGLPSSNIPRGLLENADNWLFKKSVGLKGFFSSFE